MMKRQSVVALVSQYDPFGERGLGLNDVREWGAPFYSRGPVYFFLKQAPADAIEMIVRLVNFATERWARCSS